jgi:hypothetical protein
MKMIRRLICFFKGHQYIDGKLISKDNQKIIIHGICIRCFDTLRLIVTF